MASRVPRVSPWLEPSGGGGPKRPRPSRRARRGPSCSAAALPMAPKPMTATSLRRRAPDIPLTQDLVMVFPGFIPVGAGARGAQLVAAVDDQVVHPSSAEAGTV